MRYIIIVIMCTLLSACSDKIYNTYQSDNIAYTKQIQAKYTNTINTYTLYIDSLDMPDMTEYTIMGSATVSDTTIDTAVVLNWINISLITYDYSATVISQRYDKGQYVVVVDKKLVTQKGNIKALIARL